MLSLLIFHHTLILRLVWSFVTVIKLQSVALNRSPHLGADDFLLHRSTKWYSKYEVNRNGDGTVPCGSPVILTTNSRWGAPQPNKLGPLWHPRHSYLYVVCFCWNQIFVWVVPFMCEFNKGLMLWSRRSGPPQKVKTKAWPYTISNQSPLLI